MHSLRRKSVSGISIHRSISKRVRFTLVAKTNGNFSKEINCKVNGKSSFGDTKIDSKYDQGNFDINVETKKGNIKVV